LTTGDGYPGFKGTFTFFFSSLCFAGIWNGSVAGSYAGASALVSPFIDGVLDPIVLAVVAVVLVE
jgi:hypothetical protein